MPMIHLTQGKTVVFDKKDKEMLLKYNWWAVFLGSGWYAATKISGKRILMHRMLLGLSFGEEGIVDHIDGDGLNNRRDNLRIVTHTQNMRNKKIGRNNTSGIVGVSFRPEHGVSGSWVALGMKDGVFKTRTFGCHRRGEKMAKKLAIEWRKSHEIENKITTRQ